MKRQKLVSQMGHEIHQNKNCHEIEDIIIPSQEDIVARLKTLSDTFEPKQESDITESLIKGIAELCNNKHPKNMEFFDTLFDKYNNLKDQIKSLEEQLMSKGVLWMSIWPLGRSKPPPGSLGEMLRLNELKTLLKLERLEVLDQAREWSLSHSMIITDNEDLKDEVEYLGSFRNYEDIKLEADTDEDTRALTPEYREQEEDDYEYDDNPEEEDWDIEDEEYEKKKEGEKDQENNEEKEEEKEEEEEEEVYEEEKEGKKEEENNEEVKKGKEEEEEKEKKEEEKGEEEEEKKEEKEEEEEEEKGEEEKGKKEEKEEEEEEEKEKDETKKDGIENVTEKNTFKEAKDSLGEIMNMTKNVEQRPYGLDEDDDDILSIEDNGEDEECKNKEEEKNLKEGKNKYDEENFWEEMEEAEEMIRKEEELVREYNESLEEFEEKLRIETELMEQAKKELDELENRLNDMKEKSCIFVNKMINDM